MGYRLHSIDESLNATDVMWQARLFVWLKRLRQCQIDLGSHVARNQSPNGKASAVASLEDTALADIVSYRPLYHLCMIQVLVRQVVVS